MYSISSKPFIRGRGASRQRQRPSPCRSSLDVRPFGALGALLRLVHLVHLTRLTRLTRLARLTLV